MTGRWIDYHPTARLNERVAASPNLRAAVLYVGLMVEREAKRRAPVDTGRLRASITTRIEPGTRGPVAVVGTNVDYAAAQEFGTRHGVPPTRYLGGALMAVGAQLRRRARR